MSMTSAHWAELVEPRLREAFFLGFSGGDRRQSMVPQLYGVRGSQTADEKVLGIGGIPDDLWTTFEDAGRLSYTEPVKGYEETFIHKEFALGMTVERKLIDDNRIQQAIDEAGNMGDSSFRLREKSAANVFANAFSSATSETKDKYGTDATGPDGVALCSTAHPNHPGDTSSTQTNEGTSSLTDANVSTTRVAMSDFTDMNGDILNVMPDEILVPPELEDSALVIVRSQQDPDSANNAVNPQAGRFTVKTWHYLTDSNAWFMLDSGLRRQHLRWYNRIPLEFAREQDFETLQAKFRGYQRYSLGWTDWRFIYGQNPS